VALNRMGYDAAVPGNHEFNFGLPLFQRALGTARFPYVAANLRRADGSPVLPPFVLLERAGIRVALVGLTQPGTMVWDAMHVRGRLLITGAAAELPAAVREARAAGADVIVVVAHAGLDGPPGYADSDVAPENEVAAALAAAPGVDAAIIGHTHRSIADTTVAGVLVVQPRHWAQSIGVVRLDVVREREGGRWRVVGRRGIALPLERTAPDTALAAAMAPYHAAVRAWATAPVGRASAAMPAARARLEDTPLLDWINAVQRERAGAELSSTAVFNPRGGLPEGEARRSDLATIYPYDNTLMAVRISGADLRAYLEETSRYYRGMGPDGPAADSAVPGYNFDIIAGVEYEYDLSRPVGSRVVRLRRGGRDVAPADSFTLALNNYRRQGGGGFAMLARAPLVYDRGEDIRDLLAEDLARRGTLRPEDVFVCTWGIRGLPPSGARPCGWR
jgi:2',3'-cyclic-nucleotide 2'-phosphodiesterase/3'-nucleotidase